VRRNKRPRGRGRGRGRRDGGGVRSSRRASFAAHLRDVAARAAHARVLEEAVVGRVRLPVVDVDIDEPAERDLELARVERGALQLGERHDL